MTTIRIHHMYENKLKLKKITETIPCQKFQINGTRSRPSTVHVIYLSTRLIIILIEKKTLIIHYDRSFVLKKHKLYEHIITWITFFSTYSISYK